MARQLVAPDLEKPNDITYIAVPITNHYKAKLIDLAKSEGIDLSSFVSPYVNSVARGDLRMKPVWMLE